MASSSQGSVPLGVAGVQELRANGTAVPTGVAPATSSDMFKSPVSQSRAANKWIAVMGRVNVLMDW